MNNYRFYIDIKLIIKKYYAQILGILFDVLSVIFWNSVATIVVSKLYKI